MINEKQLTDELVLRMEQSWGSDKAEKIKLLHSIGDDERKSRIEKILKLSSNKSHKDRLLNDQILMPPSTEAECGEGEIILGKVCFGRNPDGTEKELYPLKVSLDDLKHHTLISGLTGHGKTCLAYNIANQLAEKGISIIVVDWNRTWKSLLGLPPHIYPFVNDIRVYTLGRDTSPLRYNIFYSPPEGISERNWIEIIAEKPLAKSLLSGQGSGSLILNEAEELLELYQTGKLKMLPNIEDIKKRVEKQFLKGRSALWKDSAMRVLGSLCRQNTKDLFGSRNPTDIAKEILERPGITILEMDIELPNSLRILFQETFLLYVMLYNLSKGETDKLRTALILEESQNLFTTDRYRTDDGILQNLYREGRKLGLSIFTLVQEPQNCPSYVFQCRTQIHFTANTYKDAMAISNGLFLKPHEQRYIDFLGVGQALCKVKGRTKNMMIKTPKPLPTKNISDEELKELSEKWKEKN